MDQICKELIVAIFLNGRHLITLSISPEDPEEFILGYLYTEQIIKSRREVESIQVEKNRISIITSNIFSYKAPKKTILSGCGGNASFIDTKNLPAIQSDLCLKEDLLNDKIKQFYNLEPKIDKCLIYAVLCTTDGKYFQSSDIGNDNVIDRVIGSGLLKKTDFSKAFLLTSARISSEATRKSLIASIPILISTASVTDIAVDIARAAGLCLIRCAEDRSWIIYTHSERVVR